MSVEDIYYLHHNAKLGSGGFSTVILATHRNTNEKVAVKIYPGLKKAHRQCFKQEVHIMKLLDSAPNEHTTRLYDSFENPENLFLVTELMRGGDLFDRVVNKKYYTEDVARLAVKALLQAVVYCHSKQVVHRDIKPENIFLSSKENDSVIKLGDFGLATVATHNHSLTTKCGSPSYAAPEIHRGDSYGFPVDMWSIGVIVFILLSGQHPFRSGKNDEDTTRKICEVEYDFNHANWMQVSSEAKCFVSSILRQDPEDRLTAKEALQHEWFGYDTSSMYTELLSNSQRDVRLYVLKQKLRAAVFAAIAVNKLHWYRIYPNSSPTTKKVKI